MIKAIKGIHHISNMARDARRVDSFFRNVLGLRRVKQTVNFEAPDVYHLFYGNGGAEPGSVITYFPFPQIIPGVRGAGEVGTTVFAIPEGSLDFWQNHLASHNISDLNLQERFGDKVLHFTGSEGDGFALVEQKNDLRLPWQTPVITAGAEIRGFHSASLILRKADKTKALFELMNYRELGQENGIIRMAHQGGNGAEIIDLEINSSAPFHREGSGSVHHIAFAIPNSEMTSVRETLVKEGYKVTPVIDRNYFMALYFRIHSGVLIEIASNEPGFTRDEAMEHLGESLMLPAQHAHLREKLERNLISLEQ